MHPHISSWDLYFDKDEITFFNTNYETIIKFIRTLRNNVTNKILIIKERGIYKISMRFLVKIISKNQIYEQPENTIKCIACAVSEIIYNEYDIKMYVGIRITNYNIVSSFGVSVGKVEHLVSLIGTVCRVGCKKLIFKKVFFECLKCKEILEIKIVSNVYKTPKKCVGGCKSKKFVFLNDHPELLIKDFQEIKIQEIPNYQNYCGNFENIFDFSDENSEINFDLDFKETNEKSKEKFAINENKEFNEINENRKQSIDLKCDEEYKENSSEYYYDSNEDSKEKIDMNCANELKNKDFGFKEIDNDYENIKKLNMTDCYLFDDLVNTVVPGDVVSVIGIIKAEKESNGLYKLNIYVNNLKILKNKNILNLKKETKDSDFNVFKDISRNKNIICSLAHSLFKNIYGNELIKIGIVLSLFGGTKKFCGNTCIRKEIHVLLIGEPGLGKSKFLTLTSEILPKSTFICGSSTTSAGLTVSMIHDPITSEYVVDAGALVISDNSVCCLDEFDKLNDFKVLYEIMEQQSFTIAKGGVICTVPARTTIISATNPKYGFFKENKTLKENLNFNEALLSRFDLIFVLKDNLDENYNQELSKYIINNDSKKTSSAISTERSDNKISEMIGILRNDITQNLKMNTETVLYQKELISKYISYAREYVNPILSTQAKNILKTFYLSIRNKENVGIRHLEALMRLTEAKAKTELRMIANQKDAEFIVNFYKKSMNFSSKNTTNTNKKKGNNVKDIITHLKNLAINTKKTVLSYMELINELNNFEMKKSSQEIIELLNHQGYLIKKERDNYQIVI
ncbi:DNA replication licensing factor Mcm8 [Hamiltosporidium tvaerminnensis]|uniref:DNA replication licensing factor Mcm8 n=1 Tax=Hamiltosporidium tvaerminnensis TaxID=1176355 RepID=A0A4Q9LSB8_9MICR|nr:DNA replication licensing factor Mcm8 [Hamiltosporidium tvaerminnensis]